MTIKILQVFLILISASFASAQTQLRCFQNDSLRGKQIVNFETRGNSVSGTFEFENGESEPAKAYKFTGAFGGEGGGGGVLRVKFENDEPPDVAPSEIKSLEWALLKTAGGGGEILRIGFYGKNYETGEYADYFADFEACEPNYERLEKMAKPVRFAGGKTSATAALRFKNTAERKVFSLNVRRGQTLEIEAVGCKISVYLPGGGLYEFVEWESGGGGGEKTFTGSVIDRASARSMPRNGNYLIVLRQMAENASPDSATFKITN